MPYVRKSKTAKKVIRSYRRSPTSVKTMRSVAKQVMLRQVETKRALSVSGTVGLSDVIMPDNASRWLITNCMNLTQGIEENQGLGSEILASGISLKIQFKYTPPYAPYYKLFVVEANAALLGGSNTIFENSISNGMLDNIRKQYKVLKTIVVNPMLRGAQLNAQHQTPPIFRKVWIPLKKKYDFRGDNMTNGVNKNIGVIAIAYHDGLPLVHLDVGTISCYSTLYFKDP